MNQTGIIILAAGCSSRFGSVKQLLYFNNKTLLQHATDEAVASGAEPVIIVTGFQAEQISQHIKQERVKIIYNDKWEQGMASSIVAGIYTILTQYKKVDKVIITVSDQPFVTASLFAQLFQKQQASAQSIIACAYDKIVGTPVLFTRKYFDCLTTLQGDEGAKKILKANKNDVAEIDFPQGKTDIDTVSDYQNLLKKQNQGS